MQEIGPAPNKLRIINFFLMILKLTNLNNVRHTFCLVLLVEETRVPEKKNCCPATSH
jgi:hypothetical protein